MKCLNMKVGDVLFFIVNFIGIYSMNYPQDKIPLTTTVVNEKTFYKNFDKYCPHLSKIIRDNDLSDYTINCRPLDVVNDKLNVENVLGYACLIVKDILDFMCKNKINITSDALIRHNNSSICPFNFSHLEKLGINNYINNNSKFINELQNPGHCSQICSDLYSQKTQCIVLNSFNDYLKPFISPPNQHDPTNVGEVKSELPEVIKQNTEIGVPSTLQNNIQQSQKTNINQVTKKEKVEIKTETTDVKQTDAKSVVHVTVKEEKKTEKTVSVTPNELPKSDKKMDNEENDKKISEEDTYFTENNEPKPKNEDLNEDEDIPNEDDLTSLNEPNSDKPYFSQEPKSPKIESPEVIMDTSVKSKEIYSGEGFFQAEDSHFFFYFIMVSSIIVVGYLAFHNKNKILAYALEGTNGRRSRRRPNPARYRKLETNLEEVISSSATNTASSSVVY